MEKIVIGDCTLYHGDCMEVMPLLDKVDAVVTDPPFGMSFVSNFRRLETKHKAIANDKETGFLEWVCELETDHSKYIFCRWDNLYNVIKPKSAITWVKDNHSMGDLEHEHARMSELLLFYPGKNHKWPKQRPTDIIKAKRTGNNLHPTQKPVDLMMQIVPWTSGTVIDPFMGSGTTGVSCAKLGRKFIGIEIDKEYFDVAVQRIKDAYTQPDMFINTLTKNNCD